MSGHPRTFLRSVPILYQGCIATLRAHADPTLSCRDFKVCMTRENVEIVIVMKNGLLINVKIEFPQRRLEIPTTRIKKKEL